MARKIDRRIHRSPTPTLALSLQLASSRKRSLLEALLVVDEAGDTVARSGQDVHCKSLRSHVATIGQRVPEFRGVLLSDNQACSIWVKRFQVQDRELYLGAVGPCADGAQRAIDNAIAGMTRILAPAVA